MANTCECYFTEKFMLRVDQLNYHKRYELLKTGFKHRGLLQYRVVIGGMPINVGCINVTTPNKYNTYFESIGALMEAWFVHHKKTDLQHF